MFYKSCYYKHLDSCVSTVVVTQPTKYKDTPADDYTTSGNNWPSNDT